MSHWCLECWFQGRGKARDGVELKMRRSLRSVFMALVLSLVCVSGSSQEKDKKAEDKPASSREITIGLVPMLGKEQTAQKFEPLVRHLEKALGMKVKVEVTESAAKLVGLMLLKRVDFAYMGPLNYVDAHRLAGAEVLAVELSPEGKPGYYSILVSARKSGIKNLDQAKGKVFAFTDSDSTSGFMMPNIYFLRERKQTLASFAGRTEMAGSHLAVVEGVAKGKYDVGATNDMDLARACSTLKLNPNQFNILWKSELIPGAPFAAGKQVKPELKKAFLDALLGFNANKAGLKKMQIGGFAPARDSDFEAVRELAKYSKR